MVNIVSHKFGWEGENLTSASLRSRTSLSLPGIRFTGGGQKRFLR